MDYIWSQWRDINNAKDNERGYYGIYQIRIVDEVTKKPIPIPRIGGVDTEGIIYIGKAEPGNSLGNRIDNFLKGRHSGAGTYDLMSKSFKVKQHPCWKHDLEYRVIRFSPNEIEPNLDDVDVNEFLYMKKIREAEIKALAEYFSKYSELPPCNSTVPKKWTKFLEELEKVYGCEWEH